MVFSYISRISEESENDVISFLFSVCSIVDVVPFFFLLRLGLAERLGWLFYMYVTATKVNEGPEKNETKRRHMIVHKQQQHKREPKKSKKFLLSSLHVLPFICVFEAQKTTFQ